MAAIYVPRSPTTRVLCEDPAVIRRILTHLGLSMDAGEALPAARASP